MTYMFDTNSFRVTANYYPDQFPGFWDKFNQAVAAGKIISVAEVHRELDEQLPSASHLSEWVETHKNIFIVPPAPATEFVRDIFSIRHFQALISEQNRLVGRTSADPFLIAVAKVLNGCVVTEKKGKPNAPKIPNVCQHFGVDCTNLQGFMEREDWHF